MKILLVEDSPPLRQIMSSYIKRAGHLPLIAESGEAALQMIESERVDLVIMDVEMPGLNGFETTRLMRESLGGHWVPIIFVTGVTDDASFQQGIEAGGDDYMAKPVNPIILTAKIRAFERITEMQNQLERLNVELESLSQRDGLTELFNRRYFEEVAEREWQVCVRAHQPISVLMMDVDHFKPYNDFYGHQAGDSCLKLVASTLDRSLQRPADLLARYGGEEFIALLPGTDEIGAMTVAENLRKAVAALAIEHAHSGASTHVTVSIGVATTLHITGLNLKKLVSLADKALYRAKEEGRNRAVAEEYGHHKTALIVANSDEELALICDHLKDHCNIITCTSDNEGVEIARELTPDLILLSNPAGDLRTCRILKQDPATASIPVIFISEQRRAAEMAAAKGITANDCLAMPVQRDALLGKVNHLLSG